MSQGTQNNKSRAQARDAQSMAREQARQPNSSNISRLKPGSYKVIIDGAFEFGEGSLCDGRLMSAERGTEFTFASVPCDALLEYGSTATLVVGLGDTHHLVAGAEGAGGGDTVTNTYFVCSVFGSSG